MQEIVGKHATQSCFPVGKGLVLCNRSGGARRWHNSDRPCLNGYGRWGILF